MYAAQMGSREVLFKILNANPNIAISDNVGRNAFHLACLAGKFDNVDLMIKWLEQNPGMNCN